MSFNVLLYQFDKRENSTARPVSGSKAVSGLLREGCSVTNPSIAFDVMAFPQGSDFVPSKKYNYAYIPLFEKYFFVTDWISEGRTWVCNMREDVLATWSTQIGKQVLYVRRSAYAKNPNIVDTLYPASAAPTISSEYKDFPTWNYSFSSGSFVVGFINSSSSGVGASVYYAFTNAQFRNFCNGLLSTTEWLNPGGNTITEISNDLLKALFNPFQYITPCIWLPFAVTGTAVTSIPLGWNWSINANASRLSGSMLLSEALTFTVPPHPDYVDFGHFIHGAPYSQYTISVPPFGTFPLDADIVSQTEDIRVEVDTDVVTGAGRLQVRGAGYTFVDVTGMVGVPIQLAQASLNLGKASDAIASVGGAASNIAGRNVAGAISDAASGVVSALEFVSAPTITSTGSNGSIAGLGPAKMTGVFYHPATPSNRLFGSPLCEERRLNTIPGYIQIAEPHVSIACSDVERAQIEAHMQAGFFFESGND